MSLVLFAVVLCRMVSMDLYAFFYMQPSILTSNDLQNITFFPVCVSGFLLFLKVSVSVDLCLTFQFDSIDWHVCICVNTIMFLFL